MSLPCRLPTRRPASTGSGRASTAISTTCCARRRTAPTPPASGRARTLLVFGQRYAAGWPARDEADDGGWVLGVARYARGLDYHDVMRGAIRRTTGLLRRELHRTGVIAAEADLRAADAVDAGPFLEREHAWLAGLGFFGKTRC